MSVWGVGYKRACPKAHPGAACLSLGTRWAAFGRNEHFTGRRRVGWFTYRVMALCPYAWAGIRCSDMLPAMKLFDCHARQAYGLFVVEHRWRWHAPVYVSTCLLSCVLRVEWGWMWLVGRPSRHPGWHVGQAVSMIASLFYCVERPTLPRWRRAWLSYGIACLHWQRLRLIRLAANQSGCACHDYSLSYCCVLGGCHAHPVVLWQCVLLHVPECSNVCSWVVWW
jgi:hypothetical protein